MTPGAYYLFHAKVNAHFSRGGRGESKARAMICEDCRTANPDGATFCLACGVRLRSVSRPSAERRPIHVVFCDVVGSTPLSEQLDPEDLRELLQQFQRICADVVARFGGHIAQFLGDGVLVYFGYPRAREDDALRAVRAGLEIVSAVSREALAGQKVRVRVGIHSGLVVVGEVGVPGHRAELAVGETPNVAARVQAEASPDTVVVSHATERLVRGFFMMEDLGPRSLRGLSQQVRLYTVVSESGARNRLEAAKASGLTPFVGRSDEMAVLLRNWEETCAGRGRVLSILGEAGVGKSRLVEAFKARGIGDRLEIIQFGCSEYLRNSAFHPFAAALAQRSDLPHASGPDPRPARLPLHYAERFKLPAEQAAFVLADLLATPVDGGEALVDLPPTRRRQLTMDALSNWLLHLEGDSAKLVVLEDVHWADASTLELIETVAERLSSSRLLMLLTVRPDYPAARTVGRPLDLVQLRPLARADAALMASNVAGGKSLPDELTARLDDWTRGVPLYVEEFTKGLLETGVLIERGTRFELSGPLPKTLVPQTLASPLAARIDRLGPAKPVVQLAAVLGMEVRYDMLAAVSDWTENALREALHRLLGAELVVESAAEPAAVFSFRHALIRDAAYNSLLLTDRREIHRRIVQAIRNKFVDVAESRPEVVAHHAAEAGLAELAVAEWQRASERALARAANWEALAHIDEGLRQVDLLSPGPERHERQLSFELARGPALMAVKGFQAPDVTATYRRAQELCDKLGDRSRMFSILWGLWANHFVAGELVPALSFGEQVLGLAETTGDPALLVPAYHAVGYTLCYTAEFGRSLALARAGIALFDMEAERRNVRLFQLSSTVCLHQFAAISLWMLGFPEQARREVGEAIALARALSHPPSLAYAQSASTFGAPFLLSDYDAMDAASREAIELSREEKFSLWPPVVQVFRGWLMVTGGDAQGGLAQMREGLSTFRRAGGGLLRTPMATLMARAAFRSGDAAGALEIVKNALHEIASTQEHNFEPELHRVRGEILAYQQAPAEAEQSFRMALAVARGQGARSLELRAAVSLAAFLRENGRAAEGMRLVQDVYGTFTEGFETPDLCAARSLLA
jgi:class 3 adenylate cyclase/predicted ATPase